MITADNSFSTELEFFYFLDMRLNADDFMYRHAVIEAGAVNPFIIKFLNAGKGGTLEEIKNALDGYIDMLGLTGSENGYYSVEELTDAYNILAASDTQTQKKAQQALILATSLINPFEFIGTPSSPAQALQWPRSSAIDRNGSPIANNEIPSDIKAATNELAFFLLKQDITDPEKANHLYLLTSEKVGESAKSFDTKLPTKKLPDTVLNYMRPFLVEKSDYSSCLTF